MTRWKLCAILSFALAVAGSTLAATQTFADPQWPNVSIDGPQWPNVADNALPDPKPNPNPSFVNPTEALDRALDQVSSRVGSDATGSFAMWPQLPADPRPSAFNFEVGARYWYSSGSMRFGFSNGDPLFGRPTSTLDWTGLGAHSGEIFARIDHPPTGVFVKGLVGLGTGTGGDIIDRDFVAGQVSFSDTNSDVRNGSLTYAMFDIGWAYRPVADIRLGFFAGYHYWHESVTAFGVRCNAVEGPVNTCGATGDVPVGFDVAVGRYEPTWHAVRLGFDARFAITDRWSVSGEIAGVPYAALENKDSHLLRQDPSDLGPAPNVISTSKYAFGIETELFINYAITPNIEVGAGGRYWGLFTRDGGVAHGPTFSTSDQLNYFDMQRFGVLLHVKGKF